jgi:hypothetical protein
MARQRKAPKHVIGHSSTGIADHERFPEMQTEGGKHIDTGIHARDHGEALPRARIGDIRAGGGVSLIGVK